MPSTLPDLTPEQYGQIIAKLSEDKARVELDALEWRVRYRTIEAELEALRGEGEGA